MKSLFFLKKMYLINMIYYHGSKNLFHEFSLPGTGKHGEGFYFAKEYNEAKNYAYTLAGIGGELRPTIYKVFLKIKNSFNTNSIDHCNIVMSNLYLKFKPKKNAMGEKEQYYYLKNQLQSNGFNNINEAIKMAGFDSIYYEFMDHIIVFDSNLIEILELESLEQ